MQLGAGQHRRGEQTVDPWVDANPLAISARMSDRKAFISPRSPSISPRSRLISPRTSARRASISLRMRPRSALVATSAHPTGGR
jgi:hypothetical protein